MKLFKIELDNVGYDDYDSCVNYLLPKGSRLRASSTQVGSLNYE